MAIEQAQIAVGATRVVVSSLTPDQTGDAVDAHTVCIQSPDGAAGDVLLGSIAVTTIAYGHRLKPGASFSVDLGRNEVLYAIAAGSAVTVNVLRTSV